MRSRASQAGSWRQRHASSGKATLIVFLSLATARIAYATGPSFCSLPRLGLRASEVANLTFDQIDWVTGRITLAGKVRREERLPLTQEIGDAILAYIECARPRIATTRVFLTDTAPVRPLGRIAVKCIVRRALDRAGIESAHRGAHVLRHSAATAMLRGGASLAGVGAVLRHRSPSVTALYAKVDRPPVGDRPALGREVAMLSDDANRYITLRRTLGYKLVKAERHLRAFAHFAAGRGETHIRTASALDWLAMVARTPGARERRLTDLMLFARFLHAEDPRHEIPRADFAPSRKIRPIPYIYTADEIARILDAAGNLRHQKPNPLRRQLYVMLFGLIAATGLRVSEALALRLDDIQPGGVLHIRQTKSARAGSCRCMRPLSRRSNAISRFAANALVRAIGYSHPSSTESCTRQP